MADETMILAAKRLEARAKKISPCEDIYKLDINDLCKIGLDITVIRDIKECLDSSSHVDICDGFFYLTGLLTHYELQSFGKNFIDYLVYRVPELIDKNQKSGVRSYALRFFVFLKDYYPNYRDKMMSLLDSEDLGSRLAALRNYETYAKPGEIEPLLKFQNDCDVAELAMCGPLIYESRNIALEKISKVTGKNFMTFKLKEHHPNWGSDYVSWYDWSTFLEWYAKKKKLPPSKGS